MAGKSANPLSSLRRCDFSTWWEGMSVRVLKRVDLSAFEGLCQIKVFLTWVQDQIWIIHRHERPPSRVASRLFEPDRVAFSRDNEMAPAVIDGVHTFNAFSNSAGGS
jgi:hypothetical protein